jgi:hypothetical protein
MKLEDINIQITRIKNELLTLHKEIESLDHAVNTVENPDDSFILADLLRQKIEAFNVLQNDFKVLLGAYDSALKKENNATSFVAYKIKKSMNAS